MQSGFIQAAGHNLEYQLIPAHQLDRPTLVFLHEGLGSLAMWRDFPAKVAAATGCRTLAYSRYGYGESDVLTEPFAVRYMHDEALVALPELLDKLEIDKPVLVGHSDGGSIALIHAGGAGRAVAGLILMAPHVFVEDLSIASIAQAKVTFQTTDLAQKLGRYHRDPATTFRGWNDIWLHPDFRAWNIEAYLPKVSCPVLALQGADDEYGTPAQVEAIRRQAAGEVEVRMLADCRHSPHKDQPQATLEAMAGFIERIG
ncbi:MAG: alpha/beta hydrolase [Rhodocyclaceae bacterium]|jgi:pimeloyl-ACP methyl ester carboxylesterase|nr:alpha/beta hydrolase [Rhodocyclaceae bacterium]